MPAIPLFPGHQALAQALFSEGVRHLEDARVLHNAQRFPASIASSAKSAELAVKTVLVLDGASGWWERTLATHTPVTDIESHLILKRHFAQLQTYKPTLTAEIKSLESLAPSRSSLKGGQQFNQQEENPEYPFLHYTPAATTGMDVVQLREPRTYFNQTDSQRHYSTAHETVTAITAGYSDIQAWGIVVPPPL